MEPFVPIIFLLVAAPIALAVWLIVRAVKAKERIEDLTNRLASLEAEVRSSRETASPRPAKSEVAPAPLPARVYPSPVAPPPPPFFVAPTPIISPSTQAEVPRQPIWFAPVSLEEAAMPEPKISSPVNWEQFMGVKGFAWVGGFALFLGVAFFVKYSFDNNLVSPALRVAIGFLTGLALLVGGVVLSRKNFPTLSQTMCATGVVILYAVTFSCRSIYHFEFFGVIPTFVLMALITTTAFLLAVRLEALVVAILGMLGGFLTPLLLSTGQDNPVGLFGYIAILDIGLIMVALHRRWFFLPALAALGTSILQIGWARTFFIAGKYFEGNKILTVFAVLFGLSAIYLAACWWIKLQKPETADEGLGDARRTSDLQQWLSGSTLWLVAVSWAFSGWFLDFQVLAQRPLLIFGFVFLMDMVVLAVVIANGKIAPAQPLAGLAVFGLLGFWTNRWLTTDLLNIGLVFYFLFAAIHSALPVLLNRWRGIKTENAANHLFPIFALVLVLYPIFKLAQISFVVWPFILLVDLLAIVLAVLTVNLLPVLAVMILTLGATGALIFKIPSDLTGLPTSFFLLAAFVVFFVAAGVWLIRKFMPEALKSGIHFRDELSGPAMMAALLPAFSIVLPFLLLIMATERLPLDNPSPVFGLALLLVVLLFGITKLFSIDWMPAVGFACVSALECTWHFNHFNASNPRQPVDLVLTWYLIFFVAFALFPFLFFKQFASKIAPWAAAALAGIPQFFLIHRFISVVHPNQVMGLLPAAFSIPGLLSLAVILKNVPAENKSRLGQVAWFGGVALFFITLIFPIQFDRQWITIGWALEGSALLWLFHRVPHPGLKMVGVGLLGAAFARLALNPAVLEYYSRSASPILNWYLYAYGIVAVCLFVGSKLLAPPRNMLWQTNVPPILASLGTVLTFLLLNIEIADYFSSAGTMLTFQFSGNFARDMTYSIAWALFALALLFYGIAKKSAESRYAAMGLLCVTLLKLFFHDLAQLGQLYRIGAFISVAVIAMLASFAYQKFFSAAARNNNPANETSP